MNVWSNDRPTIHHLLTLPSRVHFIHSQFGSLSSLFSYFCLSHHLFYLSHIPFSQKKIIKSSLIHALWLEVFHASWACLNSVLGSSVSDSTATYRFLLSLSLFPLSLLFLSLSLSISLFPVSLSLLPISLSLFSLSSSFSVSISFCLNISFRLYQSLVILLFAITAPLSMAFSFFSPSIQLSSARSTPMATLYTLRY